MFEKFLRVNAADFRTRYHGTYGFFRDKGKNQFLCYLDVRDNEVKFVNKRAVEYTLNPDVIEDIGFSFIPPKSGCYNTVEGAVYVERAAARQFQRGICARNVRMYLINDKGFSTVPVGFKYLEMVYESTITPKAAFESYIQDKVKSVALSNEFAMDKKRVYVLGTPCGQVVSATQELVTIKLDDPVLFKTEFTDAFKSITKVEFQ